MDIKLYDAIFNMESLIKKYIFCFDKGSHVLICPQIKILSCQNFVFF